MNIKNLAKATAYTLGIAAAVAGFISLPCYVVGASMFAAIAVLFVGMPVYEHLQNQDLPAHLRLPARGQLIDTGGRYYSHKARPLNTQNCL